MTDPVLNAISESLAQEGFPGLMIGNYVLAAETIFPDGTTNVVELKSEGTPFYAAYGLARTLAATFEPMPGWAANSYEEDEEDE